MTKTDALTESIRNQRKASKDDHLQITMISVNGAEIIINGPDTHIFKPNSA